MIPAADQSGESHEVAVDLPCAAVYDLQRKMRGKVENAYFD
jgi:hypothetical protein